uniref:Uncharacterized protein n=1 Tax=Ciona savignyi TaxID=51511 RepID=H2ZJS9_CIOSA
MRVNIEESAAPALELSSGQKSPELQLGKSIPVSQDDGIKSQEPNISSSSSSEPSSSSSDTSKESEKPPSVVKLVSVFERLKNGRLSWK